MIEELLAYQEVDARLRKIEKELIDSEDRKKAVSAKRYLDTVEENVNLLDQKAEKLLAEYKRAEEDQIKLTEQQAEFKKAISGAEDKTEAEYLLKKIDELIVKIKNLTSKLNAISEELQGVLKEYVSIKQNTKNAQSQYAESGKKYNEFKATFQAEKDAVEKELETLKSKVDKNLMDRYLNKRASKIYPIVYETDGKVCGACNMQLSMSTQNDLKNGEIIDCEFCGRMIYKKQ